MILLPVGLADSLGDLSLQLGELLCCLVLVVLEEHRQLGDEVCELLVDEGSTDQLQWCEGFILAKVYLVEVMELLDLFLRV